MKKLFFLSLMVLLMACGNVLSPEDYIKYVESDNYPYKITRKYADKEFTLIYTPNEYLVLKQMNLQKTIDKDAFNNELKAKQGFMHFVFIIKSGSNKNNEVVLNETSNLSSYTNDLMYMMNDVQFDFTMHQKENTMPCVFANYERNYALTNKNNMQVVFEEPSGLSDIKIIYNDRLFNSGPVVFQFDDIKNKRKYLLINKIGRNI